MNGVIIYPREIQRKTGTMTENLERLQEYAEEERRILRTVIASDQELSGVAWRGALSYAESVQLPLLDVFLQWIREQKEANFQYKMASELMLPQMNLYQEDLEEDIRHYERRIDEEYDEEFPSRSAITYYRAMICRLREKLNAMERFVSATNRLYDRPLQILEILKRAEGELGKVEYNPVTKSLIFGTISPEWMLELETASAREYLLTQGITKEDIDHLDDMGIAPGELKTTVEKLETKEEKVLLVHSLQGILEPADWEAIENIMRKEEVYDLQYQGLVNLLGSMSAGDLEKMANLAYIGNKKTMMNFFDYKLSPVFREVVTRYKDITDAIALTTVLNPEYEGESYLEEYRNQMTRAQTLSLILTMEEATRSPGDTKFVSLSEEYTQGKYIDTLVLTRFQPIDTEAPNPLRAIIQERPGNQLTYRIYPWGAAEEAEINLDQFVHVNIDALRSTSNHIAKENLASYLASKVIDSKEVTGILSSVLSNENDRYDNAEQNIILDGAGRAIDVGNYLKALNVSSGIITMEGFQRNEITITNPDLDEKEFMVRTKVYQRSKEQNKSWEEVLGEKETLDDYVEWYGHGGAEKAEDYWTTLEDVAIEYRAKNPHLKISSVKQLTQPQIEELIKKEADPTYEINDEIMEGGK